MRAQRQTVFCKSCGATVVVGWQEPPHHLHSALTLSLIASNCVTVMSGALMLLLWIQRILATSGWGCPHCNRRT